jgi:hypothetical protein
LVEQQKLLQAGDLDEAVAGIYTGRDGPGTDFTDPRAHGSGFQRFRAFGDGYEGGPRDWCAELPAGLRYRRNRSESEEHVEQDRQQDGGNHRHQQHRQATDAATDRSNLDIAESHAASGVADDLVRTREVG